MTLADALVQFAAELPDPGKTGTVTLAGGLGAFVGATIAHLRKLPSQAASDMTRIGMLVGVGAGLTGWVAACAIDRL